jgi:hypothetical protein
VFWAGRSQAPAMTMTDPTGGLTDEGYAAADRIDLWLDAHPGWYSPSRIARGAHVSTAQAQHVLAWLDRRVLVAADGNGCWRKYSARR